jgi:endo-alpha-1,4-polygalactosaminidase (GH114 family)
MADKVFRFPFWENYQKDRVTCKLIVKNPNGSETSSTATISKYNADGTENKDFLLVIEQNTLEAIDRNTQEREERHKARREDERRRRIESEQAKKLEELFNAKLEVFEIERIKNSKDRKSKSLIRRSKNRYEMLAYTVMMLMKEIENESIEEIGQGID